VIAGCVTVTMAVSTSMVSTAGGRAAKGGVPCAARRSWSLITELARQALRRGTSRMTLLVGPRRRRDAGRFGRVGVEDDDAVATGCFGGVEGVVGVS
jgi:hypothetical protein